MAGPGVMWTNSQGAATRRSVIATQGSSGRPGLVRVRVQVRRGVYFRVDHTVWCDKKRRNPRNMTRNITRAIWQDADFCSEQRRDIFLFPMFSDWLSAFLDLHEGELTESQISPRAKSLKAPQGEKSEPDNSVEALDSAGLLSASGAGQWNSRQKTTIR